MAINGHQRWGGDFFQRLGQRQVWDHSSMKTIHENAFAVERVIVLGGYRPLCPMDSPFNGRLTHHALALHSESIAQP